jgi:2-phosphosulfolactate phosphatase
MGTNRSDAILWEGRPRPDGGHEFDPWPTRQVHVEWGATGAVLAAERGDAVVVVDVLSLSTTVTMAAEHGIQAYVYSPAEVAEQGGGDALAARLGVAMAVGNRLALPGQLSLSPASLVDPPTVTGALFSSLNGAVVLSAADPAPYLALGCLRNRTAVATAVGGWLRGSDRRRVTLLACGEHWSSVSDREGFRPCLEDQLGVGAIAHQLAAAGLELSGEAAAAAALFAGFDFATFDQLVGARELIAAGFGQDVALAADLDRSAVVPARAAGRRLTATVPPPPG